MGRRVWTTYELLGFILTSTFVGFLAGAFAAL